MWSGGGRGWTWSDVRGAQGWTWSGWGGAGPDAEQRGGDQGRMWSGRGGLVGLDVEQCCGSERVQT